MLTKKKLVHIDQTQTVYQAVERNFAILGCYVHTMLLPNIQQKFQISCYYNGWL
ncbi:uncharacterized protein VP01_2983g2 [Puccinia sorghi]|uniref:Uncharacterized protein n=1 Tax=Puccinia sorghi TaxID=27349 RepID=A0A0L6V1C5_9BASI|nr:uncharacterized protein VP01_2983g2 [Puccinia sorghi]